MKKWKSTFRVDESIVFKVPGGKQLIIFSTKFQKGVKSRAWDALSTIFIDFKVSIGFQKSNFF